MDKISGEMQEANRSVNWDYLRIDLWPDSGRMIIFPALTGCEQRIERGVCQIIDASLLRFYECLADSGISDAEFSSRLQTEERRLVQMVVDGARTHDLAGRMARSSLRLSFWEADEDQPLEEVIVHAQRK